MKKYRNTSASLSAEMLQLKKRIGRTRRRAKFVGLLYLLGIIAFAVAVAVLPLYTHALAPLGVLEFYKTFLDIDMETAAGMTKLVDSALYAIVLLVVVINVIRGLCKLGWLFKKSATKDYGFNRNVYAMLDLGKMFSGSLAAILINYFLIALLCGEPSYEMMMLVIVGVGAALHILCGVWGAKTSFFDIEEDQVVEQKREVGRFAPFFRNLLQLGAVVGMMYFLFDVNKTNAILSPLMGKGAINDLLGDVNALLPIALQIVGILCLMVLIKHATAITEFNIDGTHGKGMKNFRVFSLFAALLFGAVAVLRYMDGVSFKDLTALLIVVGIAFVMFIVELLMRKRPKHPADQVFVEEEEEEDDGELSVGNFSHIYTQPGVQTAVTTRKVKANGNEAQVTAPMAPAPITYPGTPYPMYPHACYPGMHYPLPMPMMSSNMPMVPMVPMMTPMNGSPNLQMQVQNNLLPSQMLKEALSKNGAAKRAGEALLMEEMVEDEKPSKRRKDKKVVEEEDEVGMLPPPLPVIAPVSETSSVMNTAPQLPVAPSFEQPTQISAPIVEAPTQTPIYVTKDMEVEEVDPVKYDVDCPTCNRKLRVNSAARYHRCPACSKVFQIRGVSEVEMEDDYE